MPEVQYIAWKIVKAIKEVIAPKNALYFANHFDVLQIHNVSTQYVTLQNLVPW